MPVCKNCDKVFSRQFSLSRHMKEVHNEKADPIVYSKTVWGFKCLEPDCDTSFQQGQFLINHLENVHNLKFENETIVFANANEFTLWKQSIEESSFSYYVVSKHKRDRSITYFNCNRSKTGHDGNRKLENQYKRNCKDKGSFHINSSCTSQMKVVYNENDGRVTVCFQKQHYGHEVDLAKIRISKFEREKIAVKLINGVPPKKIVQNVYDNIGEHLRRIDLLTMTDVNNIKQSFGLQYQDGKRHENDAVSLDLWVQENMSKVQDENPVLLYKKQGTEFKFLKKEDFCLIIMNKFQRTMLKKFGSSILTIDGTHGLNYYDFELTTLMVLDEFREGFPVAFMFSNRKDTSIYQLFFQHIVEKIGEIQPKIFMSDLAMAYFNAWISVMGAGDTQHLYCAWHVDRAWQSNIAKVKGIEKKKEVKKALKTLQQNTSEENFELCLNNTITLLLDDEDTREFGNYFRNNYVTNCKKWAYCFRKDSSINTNMHVEAMHKVLKYIYADRKTVRRLDKGLNLILQYLRDKSRERIVKLVKGRNSKCKTDIFKRHCEAQKLNNYDLTFSEGLWNVKKESGETYDIKQVQEFNCCADICSICNICRHIYSCTCLDSNRQKIICKHIHYIVLHIQEKKLLPENKYDGDFELFYNVLEKPNQDTNKKINNNIDIVFCKLRDFNFNTLDDSTLEKIHYHLNIVENLTTLSHHSVEESNFIIKENSNKRVIDPQLRFSSTKKKQKTSTTTSSTIKVSDAERSETKKMLQDNCGLIISSNSQSDHLYC